MIDVQERPLGALQQHASRSRDVGPDLRPDIRLQLLNLGSDLAQRLQHLLGSNADVRLQRGQDRVRRIRPLTHHVDATGEVGEIADAQADSGGLVPVRRTDSPAGGADRLPAARGLLRGIELLVVGKDEVRPAADPDPAL